MANEALEKLCSNNDLLFLGVDNMELIIFAASEGRIRSDILADGLAFLLESVERILTDNEKLLDDLKRGDREQRVRLQGHPQGASLRGKRNGT